MNKTEVSKKIISMIMVFLIITLPVQAPGNPHDNLKDLHLEIPETQENPAILKQEAINTMELLNVSDYDQDSVDKINFIVNNILQSLTSHYWWNETLAWNDKIFELEKDAAQQIRVLINREKKPEVNQTILIPSIIKLIQADNNLAFIAKEEAEWASRFSLENVSSYLENATEHYDKAWWHIDRGFPVTAIEFFGKSWNDSYSALIISDQSTTPNVTIKSPYDGIYTNLPEWTLEGTVFDVRIYTIPEVSVVHNSNEYALPLAGGLFTNQITLEENDNTIKVSATDLFSNTGSDQIFLILDTILPAITITGVEDGAYYNYDITPHIEVFDLHLDYSTIKLNSDAFESDTTLTEESDYILEVSAVDKAGNSASETLTFTLDKTPPTITDNYADDGVWINQDQTVTLIPTDELSGIKEVKYCEGTGCEPNILLESPYKLYYAIDQDTIVRYQTWDKATNPSIIGEYNVKLDKTNPTTSDDYAYHNLWINSDPTITIIPSDPSPTSGIDWTRYCKSGECNPDNNYINHITISTENINYLRYASKDNAGNLQPTRELIIKLDKTPPVTTDNAPTDWQANDVNVVLTPLDIYSGVASTQYCVDTDNACTPYVGGVSLSVTCSVDNVCNKYIRYYSIDKVDNQEETKPTNVIKIDKEKPVTELSIGTPKYISDKNYVTSNTLITLSADDGSGSGVAKIEYKVDGDWLEYTEPFTLKSERLNTVYYRTIDNVGNVETTKSIEIIVDNTPPELRLTDLTENPTLDDPSYTFSIETEVGATVTVNGEIITLIEGKANYTVNITEGVNTFTVISKDHVENPTSKGITRFVDTDKLPDFYEIEVLGTDPLNGDTDANGITDDREDFDIDILTNYGEYINDADPFSNDTDKDGLYDFFELGITTTYVNKYDSDENGISDANEDFDNDGLINLDEQYWRTDPWFNDSDLDTISDGEEIRLGTNPLSRDTDLDGISDQEELELGFDPVKEDSNNDGIPDNEQPITKEVENLVEGAHIEVVAPVDVAESVEIKDAGTPYAPLSRLSGIATDFIDFSADGDIESATIKIYYNETDLNGMPESSLKLFYFDETTKLPVEAPNQILNTEENYIEAPTNHLSVWFIGSPSQWQQEANVGWNRPDLVLSAGETVRLKTTVRNRGPSVSHARVDFYKKLSTGDIMLIDSTYVNVPQDGSVEASITTTVDPDADEILVTVDPVSSIRETNENNNGASRVVSPYLDSDADGLADSEEINGLPARSFYKAVYTDPFEEDTDGDGINDGDEISGIGVEGGRKYYNFITYPDDPDSDHDGLLDSEEFEGWQVHTIETREDALNVIALLPDDPDTEEVSPDFSPYIHVRHVDSEPMVSDTDNDGLNDLQELELAIDPRSFDTDNDWVRDLVDDDPTVIELIPPEIYLFNIRTDFWGDWRVLWRDVHVDYEVTDNTGIDGVKKVEMLKDSNVIHTHNRGGSFSDIFTYNVIDVYSGILVEIEAIDRNGNIGYSKVTQVDGITMSLAGFITFIGNIGLPPDRVLEDGNPLIIAAEINKITSSGGFSGFVYAAGGIVKDIAVVLENPGAIFEGVKVFGEAIRTQDPEFIGNMWEAVKSDVAPYHDRSNPYKNNPLYYESYKSGWIGGYVAGFVVTSILGLKGVDKASKALKSTNLVSTLAKTKAFQILIQTKNFVLKNKLLITGSAIAAGYGLNYIFPDLDIALDIGDTALGAAPLLVVYEGLKKLSSLRTLTPSEQKNILDFTKKWGAGEGNVVETKATFVGGLDDVSKKTLGGLTTDEITGTYKVLTKNSWESRSGLINAVKNTKLSDGFDLVRKSMKRGDTGTISQIKYGNELKLAGRTIQFEKSFTLQGEKFTVDVFDKTLKINFEVKRIETLADSTSKISSKLQKAGKQLERLYKANDLGGRQLVIDMSQGTTLSREVIKNTIGNWKTVSPRGQYIDRIIAKIPGQTDIIVK